MSYTVSYVYVLLSAHPEVAEVAVRCLAYAGSIYPPLWTDYCGGDEEGAGTRVMVSVVKNAAARLFQIMVASAANEGGEIDSHGTYAGFDLRDVKEFGLSGMQEVIDAYQDSKGRASMSADHTQTQLLTLLMIICKCLEARSSWIGSEVEHYRVHNLGERMAEAAALAGRDGEAEALVHSLLSTLRVLYNLLRTVQEDVYLSCIKAIAFINYQFPPRWTTVAPYSTEIAELCCKMKFDEHVDDADSKSANLAEGLLHLVNDIGYPSHDGPEAAPVLALCTSLVCVPVYSGYFYTNDVKVLAEVIIRELSNMPQGGGRGQASVFGCVESAEDRTAGIRDMYVRLAGALVDRTAWSTVGERHKFDEVRSVVDDCLRDELSDEARTEFEDISSKFY
jgi:hypothetical protein